MGDIPKYKIDKSPIHGLGIFANEPIPISTKVDKVCIKQHMTPWFGTLINHSLTPNGVMMKLDDDYIFVASSNIKKGEELTLNYWQRPPFLSTPPELGIVE